MYIYKKSFCGKPKKIHNNVNIHNQIMEKGQNKSFFILHGVMSKSITPHT